jgi:hypothetical protein
VADWDAFNETLETFAEPHTEDVLREIQGIMIELATPRSPGPGWAETLQIYLCDPSIAQVVEAALEHVAAATPLLVARVQHDVMPTLWRQPLGDDLV